MYNYKIFLFNCSAIFSLVFSGCSKLLEVEPPRNQLTTDMVFSDSLSAISALGNTYYLMGNSLIITKISVYIRMNIVTLKITMNFIQGGLLLTMVQILISGIHFTK